VLGEAGKIRDLELNKVIAGQILTRWREAAGAGKSPLAGIAIESEIFRGADLVGKQTLTIAAGKRVSATYEIDGKRTTVVCDGEKYWLQSPGKETQEVTLGKALRDPHFAQGATLASLLAADSLGQWGQLALDGSDKAQRRLCYRLSATEPSSEQLFVWLSVTGSEGQPHIELVKSGVGIDNDEPIPSTIYTEFRPLEGLMLPTRRTLVHGLAEQPDLAVVTSQARVLTDVSDEVFRVMK
jgi:hypothetical protein